MNPFRKAMPKQVNSEEKNKRQPNDSTKKNTKYFEAPCLLLHPSFILFSFLPLILSPHHQTQLCCITRPLYTGIIPLPIVAVAAYTISCLEAASCRLWCRRSADAALVAAPRTQPLLGAEGDFAIEFVRGLLAVDEVAEAAAHAALARVKTAAGFAEVGDGAEFAVNRARGVPAAIEFVAGLLGRVFVFESRVDVADEVCILQPLVSKNGMSAWYARTYDRCCCRRQRAPRARRTCRARTKCPHKRLQSGSGAATGSCGSWGRGRDSGKGWA